MRSRCWKALAVVLALALFGAACGGDDELDEEAAEEEIRANIDAYFSGMGQVASADEDEVEEVLDETMQYLESATDEDREAVRNFGPLAEGLSVDIGEITFPSDEEAEFTFDLLIQGNPTQVTDSNGKAVLEDDRWKLSQETWQALAALADTGGGEGEGEGEGEGDGEGEGELDEEAAEAEIRANIDAYFTGMGQVASASEDEVEAVLDNTMQYLESASDDDREAVRNFGPLAEGLSVDIGEITFPSDTQAEFTFDLLIQGNPTQVTDSNGKAVFEDGTWKLSQETWQALAALADTGGGEGGEGEGEG